MEKEVIINRVADSALTTINLEDFYPKDEVKLFDLKDFLFMNLILKEKDYREALKHHDWNQYSNNIVALTCTADAIIPMWAYMLAGSYLQPVAKQVVFGNTDDAVQELIFRKIRSLNPADFEGKRIVVKGCGEKPVGEKAYLEISLLLRPVARSIMYGEPCSTVPVFKKAATSHS